MPRRYTAFAAPAQAGRVSHRTDSNKSTLREAFLRALASRVNRGGRVVIPTGIVDCGEVARVLTALERARQVGRRR